MKLIPDQTTRLLKPVPPEGGRGKSTNYYHFLFDLLLPLSIKVSEKSARERYAIESFGPLEQLLPEIFDTSEVIICGRFRKFLPGAETLVGMNPKIVGLDQSQLGAFRHEIFTRLSVAQCSKPSKVILIERGVGNDDKSRKGSGVTKRSIDNHQELESQLRTLLRHPQDMVNARLETLSFREQLELFSSAALVIAQHGAGMSNCVWMRPGTSVLEFGYRKRPHFERLCASNGQHFVSDPFEHPHIQVNPSRLSSLLEKLPGTQRLFK